MNSNSNSFDSFLPKIEVDIDSRVPRLTWNSEMTKKLIETLETECQVIWNAKHVLYKDKVTRQAKTEYLANMFGTTTEEINRKIHNLRSQYNNELRKLKKRQESGVEKGTGLVSGWEYFDAMSFLKTAPSIGDSSTLMMDPLDTTLEVDSVNLALAEFQAEEEREFAAARARFNSPEQSTSDSPGRKKPTLKVAASAPSRISTRTMPIVWTEQPLIQPGTNADECQIFGDFVASELRTLRSESRKKLKRVIQKAILQVGEEEDENMYYSSHNLSSSRNLEDSTTY